MAYQNVGTPRFYIDLPTYLRSIKHEVDEIIGVLDIDANGNILIAEEDNAEKLSGNIFGLDNPETPSFKRTGGKSDIFFDGKTELQKYLNMDNLYFALINTQSYQGNPYSTLQIKYANQNVRNANSTGIINAPYLLVYDIYLGASGFSMLSTDWDEIAPTATLYSIRLSNILRLINVELASLGNISFGSYYDMPVNPDLELTMDIEFDGYDSTEDLRGSTITNTTYSGSPWWYDTDGNKKQPWTIGDSNGIVKRNGRRTWNHSFSYMTDSDLFASNYMNNTYANPDTLTNYNPSDIAPTDYGTDLIDNGTFTGNANGWSILGTGTGDYDDNNVKFEGGTVLLRQSGIVPPLKAGKSYLIMFEVEEYTSGIISFQIGNQIVGFTEFDGGNRWYIFNALCEADTDSVRLNSLDGDTEFIGSIDNVSVKELLTDNFYYTIGNDDSFHAQVLNRICLGQRFIFQPDNTNNNPDQFAICTLDQNSFKIERVAFNVYNIGMKIKEVW